MGATKKSTVGDTTPVAGGRGIPASMVRNDLPDLPADGDELTTHVRRLMALHPEISLGFRATDLVSMPAADKLVILGAINQALGIKPLKSS